MLNLSEKDRALLIALVPIAQCLVALDAQALRAWLWQMDDHARAVLVTWVVHQGPGWVTATIDPPDSAREIGGQA